MFQPDPSRMYAALRCIEMELVRPRSSIKRIREIMFELSRELPQQSDPADQDKPGG